MHRQLRSYLVSLCQLKQFSGVQFKEFQFPIDSNNKLLFRVIWFFILSSCLCTCCYQIGERISYFLSSPFKVDVEIGDLNLVDEFEMQFCSGYSQHVIELLNQFWSKRFIQHWYYVVFPVGLLIERFYPNTNYSLNKLWHFNKNKTILNNVSFFRGHEQKFLDMDSISHRNEITLLGFCKAINLAGNRIKEPFQIDVAEEYYQPSGKLVLINTKLDISTMVAIMGDESHSWRVSFRKYKHEKRKDFKGVSRQILKDCVAKCSVEMSNKTAKCRLPVHSKTISLPHCNKNKEILDSYISLQKAILWPDKYDECRKDCMWLNDGIAFSLHAETIRVTPNISRINVKMDENVVIFVERFVYDGINLLKDFGGILNLFAGLSILIIFDVVFNTLNYISLRRSLNIIYKKNAKFTKINRKFDAYFNSVKEKRKIAQKTVNIQINRQRLISKTLQIGVYIFCLILAILMMYQCFDRYFQYPVRSVIEIQSSHTFIFPTVILCGLSPKIYSFKKKLAKKNNWNNWCKLDLLDLLDFNKSMTINHLWEMSIALYGYYLFDNILGITSLKPNRTEIKTYLGNCHQYKFGEDTFQGYLKIFFQYFIIRKEVKCVENFQVFINAEVSNFYDIFSRVDMTSNNDHYFNYRITILKRLNLKNRPCMKTEAVLKCQNDCLNNQIQSNKLCRLPFIPKNLNLSECSSINNAKQSRERYIQIQSGIITGNTCNCKRQCKKVIISRETFTNQRTNRIAIHVSHTMTSDVYECFIEKREYSVIALLCDIGNILGMTLGISIITFAKYFQRITFYVYCNFSLLIYFIYTKGKNYRMAL